MRLIDADRPKRALQQTIVEEKLEGRDTNGLQQVVYLLDSCPTVDAVPVVHGEWIYHECVSSYDGTESGYSCSRCCAFVTEETFDMDFFHKEFCGHCGAKMDGGGIRMDDLKEKLISMIQEAVGGCARHWASLIADRLIANGVTMQDGRDNDVPTKWVPVTERLPEDSVAVNLHTKSGVVGTGFYDKHTKSWVQYYSGGAICVDVTHWQPMPQQPKGE